MANGSWIEMILGAPPEEPKRSPVAQLFRGWPPRWAWIFVLACFAPQLYVPTFGLVVYAIGAWSVVVVSRDLRLVFVLRFGVCIIVTVASVSCWFYLLHGFFKTR